MKTGLVHHVSQQLSLKSPLTAQYSVLHVVYLSPGMLFTFPQGFVYASPVMLFTFS